MLSGSFVGQLCYALQEEILIFGIVKYNQMPNAYGLIGITLIIAGVLIVNLLGKVN